MDGGGGGGRAISQTEPANHLPFLADEGVTLVGTGRNEFILGPIKMVGQEVHRRSV